MKKLISVLLATVLLFVTAIGTNAATVGSNPLPEEGSGMCGKNMYWSRSDNGTLKIFGFGEMYDYHDGDNDILNIPWQKNDNSTAITEIIIEYLRFCFRKYLNIGNTLTQQCKIHRTICIFTL